MGERQSAALVGLEELLMQAARLAYRAEYHDEWAEKIVDLACEVRSVNQKEFMRNNRDYESAAPNAGGGGK